MEPGFRKVMFLACGTTLILAGCGGGTSRPPISVSIQPLSTQSVDQGQAVNVTAVVMNDPSNQGVTWSVSCSASNCGKISTAVSGVTATYTAPSPITIAFPVTLVAKSVKDPSKEANSSITVVVPPSVTTTSLAGGTGGESYSAVLQEAGGLAPFIWSISAGSLPAGLGLAADGTISGTPTMGGNSKFTVQVADSGSPSLTASANLSIEVVVLPLTISTLSLPNGAVDEAYKQQILVTGGIPPYVWSIQSGALSSWASLNSSTGTISGIPDATGTANFMVAVADSEASPSITTVPLSLTTIDGTQANNSELNGHYAFLLSGFDDSTGSRVSIAGSFTADGKGKIAAGIEDENGPSGPIPNTDFSGTYNIDANHRGALTIYTPNGSRTFALALSAITNGPAQSGRLVEFDDTSGTSGRRGSGVLRAQDVTAFSLTKISGPYAFGFAGQDPAGNSQVIVGSFNAEGTGAIPSGVADQNVGGTATNPTLTGNYTSPSTTNGRMVLTLNMSGSENLGLSAYVVSPNELLAVTTDSLSSSGLMSGQIVTQDSTSYDNSAFNAPSVYYLCGVNIATNASQSTAEIGLLQPTGNGDVAVEYDYQTGAAIAKDQSFTATYAVTASGRGTISGWGGQSGGPPQVFYLTAKNKGFFLDASHAGLGFFESQSAVPSGGFSNGSLSGIFAAGTVSPSVGGNLNGTGLVTLDGAGSFTEVTDASTPSGLTVDQTTSGTYSIASEGRGTVTSLSVTTANLSASMIALAVLLAVLIGRIKPRRNTNLSVFATLCCAAWFATTPAACPPPPTNQLVFYSISPTKAVMIHEQSATHTPEITIIEQ